VRGILEPVWGGDSFLGGGDTAGDSFHQRQIPVAAMEVVVETVFWGFSYLHNGFLWHTYVRPAFYVPTYGPLSESEFSKNRGLKSVPAVIAVDLVVKKVSPKVSPGVQKSVPTKKGHTSETGAEWV